MKKALFILITGVLTGLCCAVQAAPIEISKSAQRTFVQPTLQIRNMKGNKAFCDPFYRYLVTCGWFRVVKGTADYTLDVTGGDGKVAMQLYFGENPVLNKNIGYSGDERRAAARSVDELIQARFRQKLCDSQLVFTAETKPGIKEVFICDTDGGNLRKVTDYTEF